MLIGTELTYAFKLLCCFLKLCCFISLLILAEMVLVAYDKSQLMSLCRSENSTLLDWHHSLRLAPKFGVLAIYCPYISILSLSPMILVLFLIGFFLCVILCFLITCTFARKIWVFTQAACKGFRYLDLGVNLFWVTNLCCCS